MLVIFTIVPFGPTKQHPVRSRLRFRAFKYRIRFRSGILSGPFRGSSRDSAHFMFDVTDKHSLFANIQPLDSAKFIRT